MNNLKITKRVLKDLYHFKIDLTYGSKNCLVKQYSQDIVITGIISDNFKEIKLSPPLYYDKKDKNKTVEILKIPKENLPEVLAFVNP